MKRLFQHLLTLFLVIAVVPFLKGQNHPNAASEEGAVPWTDADSRLANHYLQLLQKNPEFGNVLNLLWELYENKNQTPLLMDYMKKAAAGEQAFVPQLIYAHLLRTADRSEEAREFYESAARGMPESVPALIALAELAEKQKRSAKALSYYNRIVKLVPPQDDVGVAIRLRKAALHQTTGDIQPAQETWNELLAARPEDAAIRNEIVGRLFEAGETDTAIAILEKQVNSPDVKIRLAALADLERVYELVNNFKEASRVSRAAMSLLHFKNHQHREFFQRLVRSHERENRLSQLEEELKKAVSEINPDEASLYLLALFYQLTADHPSEETILQKLVERLPKSLDYRVRLAELQLDNDRYQEAAATLDAIIADQGSVPLHLLFLRARVDLHAEERDTAADRLLDHLSSHPGDQDLRGKIIDFARVHHLDVLIEKLLRQSVGGNLTGSDGDSAPLDLAKFLHERGRKSQAREVLDSYISGAGDSVVEKSRRLHQTAVVWRDLNQTDLALESIGEALASQPDHVDLLTTRAQLLIDHNRGNEAIALLETILSQKTELKDKIEVDQKIFSILRAGSREETASPLPAMIPGAPILSVEDYRKLAAAVASTRREADEAPPQALIDYYEQLLQDATRSRSVAKRYRAAWWAFKMQKYQDCYFQLQAAKQESEKPLLEIEEMLLELAEQNDRPEHMVKILDTLGQIDPDNYEHYRHRWAEAAFRIGNEDQAVRELLRLASNPDVSLDTLATLAKIYAEQGSPGKQAEVWRTAYRKASLFDKRNIVRQLTTALIEQNKPREALEVQMDLIERETDLIQRRKQFENQLTLATGHTQLDWMLDRYVEAVNRKPFDRFLPEALGKIQLALHRDREAFASLKKAYYMSDENEALLSQLSDLASRLGEPGAAIYYSRQAIARGEGSDHSENWENLIKMLEKDFRTTEADLMRRRLEAKFGQDPDFLKRLGDYYLSRDRPSDALRLYAKRVQLRDWDSSALFDLALAKQRTGAAVEAGPIFETIVAQTSSLPEPDWSLKGGLWPLIEASRDPGTALDALSHEFFAIPYLAASAKDDLRHWIEARIHTEFQYRPDDAYALRLRAIEEASRNNPTWAAEFLSAAGTSVHEKLWAFHHAGASKSLPLPAWPETTGSTTLPSVSRALTLVRARRSDLLSPWLENGVFYSEEAITPRAAVAFAFYYLLNSNSVQFDSYLSDLYQSLEAPAFVTNRMFVEFRKRNRFQLASQFGSDVAQRETASDNSALPFFLAQLSGWRGALRTQADWLDIALNRPIKLEATTGLPPIVSLALADRCHLASSPEEKTELLDGFEEKLESAPGITPLVRAQFQVVRGLATENRETAWKGFESLTQEIILPRQDDPLQPASNIWERMHREFRFHLDWFPRDLRGGAQFALAFGGPPFSLELTNETLRQNFELFETQRLLAFFDGQPQGERAALLARALDRYRNLDGRLDLARELEKQGYHREAAAIYYHDVVAGSQDYAVLRGFLSCADRALDPEKALPVLEKLRTGELAFPPGLTDAYLKKYQARFLYHARRLDEIHQLSQPVDPGGNSSVKPVSHLPSQDEKIRAHLIRGEWDDLLKTLADQRKRNESSNRDLLLGARILIQQGSPEKALDWLDAITRNRSDLDNELAALDLYLQVFRTLPEIPIEQLKWLGRAVLPYKASATIHALADLFEAQGDIEEALSLLRLHYQDVKRTESKSAAQREILSLLLKHRPEDLALLEDELSVLLTGLTPESLAPFATLLVENQAALRPLLPILERHHTYPAIFASAFLNNDLSTAWKNQQENNEDALWFLAHLGASGQSVAQEEVTRRAEIGSFYFEGNPEKQLRFFHLIGDRGRLLDSYSAVARLAKSYTFIPKSAAPEYGSFATIRHIPRVLRELGHDDLAGPLYRRFYENIRYPGADWTPFIEECVQFFIDTRQFEEAEQIGIAMSRVSLGFDLRLLVNLYEEQGRLDSLDAALARYELTSGQRALLSEWQQARHQGREMEAYRAD